MASRIISGNITNLPTPMDTSTDGAIALGFGWVVGVEVMVLVVILSV
jgi:hypothetical protein